MSTERKPVATDAAPRAIGPYSQAILASGMVFCSGQIALDPESGAFVGAADVRVQTRRVLENLRAVLEAAGSSLDRVVKTTIYLTDMGDFGAVNEIYGTFFKDTPPARATVQVAGLPKGASVEIDAIALAGAIPG
jgi:2-iminobutanoate/2-iminopropanoate deaminase